MNYFFKKISPNDSGSTLLASLIVLSVFLTVGMIVSNIIIRDISLNRDFGDSNYAYYAANMGYQKALWLLNNEIFSNDDAHAWDVTFSPYITDMNIDMCPDTWDEEGLECPCPIFPTVEDCQGSASPQLIISEEVYPGGPSYEVYFFLDYNDAVPNNLNRTITLTSIGSYNNAQRKIEYSACIGNGCK